MLFRSISRNIIYGVHEDTNTITSIVIEVMNTLTNNLDYITVPANSQFTLTSEMYQRVLTASPNVPQVIQMSDLLQYFDGTTGYDYGIYILEEAMGIDIGYYTAMNQDIFDTLFESNKQVITYDEREITEDGGTKRTGEVISEEMKLWQLDRKSVV